MFFSWYTSDWPLHPTFLFSLSDWVLVFDLLRVALCLGVWRGYITLERMFIPGVDIRDGFCKKPFV